MKFIIFFFACIGFCGANESFISPIPQEITYDKQKADLGKSLFFDPILSKNRDISCFNCHHSYGADTGSVSFGTAGQKGIINAPSLFNAVFDIAQFHNGRADTLHEQAKDTLFNPLEMDISKELAAKRLHENPRYVSMFKKLYNNAPNLDDAIDAIVEYQKTLITPGAKFDRYLNKKATLTQKEQKGYELFKSKGCITCHNGINVGGNSYQKFGNVIAVAPYLSNQNDRYAVTKNEEDRNVFKVPSLRNVTKTAPYFHDGSIDTLADAINIMALYNLATQLQQDEIDAIIAFLHTLEAPLPKNWRQQ
ncbi:MAG: cytochrome-c peroxidase [Campylobacterota bacterium]